MSQDEEDQDFGIRMGVLNKELDQEEIEQIQPKNPFPTPTEHRILYKSIGKGGILMKCMIFGLVTILISILIILFIANLNQYYDDNDNDEQIHTQSQYSTDPSMNKQNRLYCPSKYSFSPVYLKCLKCDRGCEKCQPGVDGFMPCIQCQKNYNLIGDFCIKQCPKGYQKYDGYCLLDRNKNFNVTLIDLNHKIHTQIPYIIYKPINLQECKSITFLIPPIGNNQLYYSRIYDFSQFSQQTNTILITMATPIEQVTIFPYSSNDQLSLVELIIKNIQDQVFKQQNINHIIYVGIENSPYLVYQFYHFMQYQISKYQFFFIFFKQRQQYLQKMYPYYEFHLNQKQEINQHLRNRFN